MYDGGDVGSLHGFLGQINDIHLGFDHLAHVVVLVFDFCLHATFAVFAVEQRYHFLDAGFACLEVFAVVVTDDIVEHCFLYRALHADQVEEALVALRMGGCLVGRQQVHETVGYQLRVFHLLVPIPGVYVHAVEGDLCFGGVEVLVLQFAYGAAVDGVSKICPEFRYVKVVGSLADLFVGRETDTYLAVLDFGMCLQVLYGAHDSGHAGFVVGSQ